MKLLIAVLFAAFLVGGSVSSASILRRPVVVFGGCLIATMMFFSQKFL